MFGDEARDVPEQIMLQKWSGPRPVMPLIRESKSPESVQTEVASSMPLFILW